MKFTRQNLIYLKAFGVIFVVFFNIYLLWNYKTIDPRIENPALNCPEYTFWVEETLQCVPFRNDLQEHLYKMSKACKTLLDNKGCCILDSGVVACEEIMATAGSTSVIE